MTRKYVFRVYKSELPTLFLFFHPTIRMKFGKLDYITYTDYEDVPESLRDYLNVLMLNQ